MYTYPRPQNLAYPDRVLFNEGTLLEALLKWDRARAGRRGNPKVDAAPGDVPRKHAPGRPWVSVRPVRVCHCELAGRGQASGAKSPGAKPPEERTRVLRRRDGASKGVAVCLYFPAIRETSRGRYQDAPFGAPSPLKEGRSTKSPTRAAARECGRLAV